ncbi:PREDICTED: uncharacterized protein LOC107190703 [Dufourea novaeangliae]|uniref:Uncharacterized protein n=1 Tax=Dufourea novaeangliae TaxID=178035 RepID=A0A154PMV1_DUFNO|nr:PREDICTED: uncharacterized protein LOC107190703 [Dufourea novaeangliae]KZC12540.1 hypothetical protein WN55_03292 [Dufourea novaeangliae]
MYSGTVIWFLIGVYSISNFRCCYSYVYDRPKVVTYGEPCIASRQFPIRIEGPKPAMPEQKIPLSLDFRVVSEMYVEPRRRVEYPIAIDAPCPTTSSPSERIIVDDDVLRLRGKTYAYSTYVPPAEDTPTPSKYYNFSVNIPITSKEITSEQPTERYVQRLRGLATRVDRVLVPACEVSQAYRC